MAVGKMSPVAKDLYQYLWLQDGVKDLQNQQNDLKKRLIEHAEQHGLKDDKGHLIFKFDGDVVSVEDRSFLGFMKQRRVSINFNEDRAEELCESLEIPREEYTVTETYPSQDKVARLYAEDKLTDEQWDSLFDTNESWAFVPVKVD